jgi:hypothetical protein
VARSPEGTVRVTRHPFLIGAGRMSPRSSSLAITVKHVALAELAEDAAQLGAVGLRVAGLLAVDFGATFGAELLELSVERLPIGADAGVSEVAILWASFDHIFCKP